MSEEFYIKVLESVKEYMQDSINNGYSKFVYNDLGWDEKCVDIISAIDMLIEKNKELNKEKEKNKELKNCVTQFRKQVEELEKYDYRKIKIDEKNKISSIHFTKEQLDLMNLGIALYGGIPKILKDTENEETDI